MKHFILLLSAITLIGVQPVYAEHGESVPANSVFVDINGLVCDFCAQALEKVFSKKEAVSEIDVNLDTKILTLSFKDGQSLDDADITALINDSGYSVEKITHAGEAHE